MAVMAAHAWGTNAEMIADIADLGYIGDTVLDATYGLGRFWSKYQPNNLISNDAHPLRGDLSYDFTSFPEDWEGQYDTVVFDPPYKLNGTPTLGKMDEDYGIATYTSLNDKLDLISRGVTECVRVTKAGGTILVKIQDQVASGRMWFQSDMVHDTLCGIANKVAVFHFLTKPRPQPEGRRQINARNNYSTLLIFKKLYK